MKHKKWLFLILAFQAFYLESHENLLNSLYPTQEEILNEDLPTSLCGYHHLIINKEETQCFDEIYVEALYRVPYFLVDQRRAIETLKKIEAYDKNLPKMTIEDGYLVTDRLPSYITEEEKQWFKKFIVASGLCASEEDVEFSNDKIKAKLKKSCCCKSQKFH